MPLRTPSIGRRLGLAFGGIGLLVVVSSGGCTALSLLAAGAGKAMGSVDDLGMAQGRHQQAAGRRDHIAQIEALFDLAMAETALSARSERIGRGGWELHHVPAAVAVSYVGDNTRPDLADQVVQCAQRIARRL